MFQASRFMSRVTGSRLQVKNLYADLGVVTLLYLLYTKLPYFQNYFSDIHYLFVKFTALDFFYWLYVVFIVFIFPFRLLKKNERKSKCLILFEFCHRIVAWFFQGSDWKKITFNERTAIMSLVVRSFYFPLMINWVFFHSEKVVIYLLEGIIYNGTFFSNFFYYFDNYLFWFLFNLIFLVDTIIFATSYLIESNYLGNRIRSVEPTIFGWAIALACYPPFNSITTRFIPWKTEDFVSEFSTHRVNFTINIIILISLLIYVWASVALGFKASNLVNRGIVKTGPYKFVRHPAYISKNFAWWMGSLPFIYLAWQTSSKEAFLVIIYVALWSSIYCLRALTEERHLLRDPEYVEYVKKVKWRFVPRVF